MSKQLKKHITNDLERRFNSVSSYVIVDYRGLDSAQTYELRKTLHDSGARMTVVPNRLALKVLDRWEGRNAGFRDLFRGPTAIVSGKDGAVGASKAVFLWKKKKPKNKNLLPFRGGILEGKILTPEVAESLSKIPDRPILLSMVVGGLQAPLTRLAMATRSIVARVAWALDAHRKKLAESAGTGSDPSSVNPESTAAAGDAAGTGA